MFFFGELGGGVLLFVAHSYVFFFPILEDSL